MLNQEKEEETTRNEEGKETKNTPGHPRYIFISASSLRREYDTIQADILENAL